MIWRIYFSFSFDFLYAADVRDTNVRAHGEIILVLLLRIETRKQNSYYRPTERMHGK